MWDTNEKAKKPAPKPAKMPLVSVAHPGQSYHPIFDEHQSILKKVSKVNTETSVPFCVFFPLYFLNVLLSAGANNFPFACFHSYRL